MVDCTTVCTRFGGVQKDMSQYLTALRWMKCYPTPFLLRMLTVNTAL